MFSCFEKLREAMNLLIDEDGDCRVRLTLVEKVS